MLHLEPRNSVSGSIDLRLLELSFSLRPGELRRGATRRQHQREAYQLGEKFHDFIFLLEVTEPRVRDQAIIFNRQRSHPVSLMGIL